MLSIFSCVYYPPLFGAGGEGDDRGCDGWMASLDGHEFAWTAGVGYGQGGLACWDSWGHKESDTTERLIWSESISWKMISHCSFNLHFFFMSKVEFLFMHLRTILFLRLRWSVTCRLWIGFELMGSYPLLADNFFLFELFLWTFISYSNAKIRLLWCELQRFICLLTESSMQKFSLI